MDIIKTGIGIGKTIKNVSRLREIVNVFAQNGFDEFITKTNLHKKIPGLGLVIPKSRLEKSISELADEEDWWKIIGYRLRKSFEVLGPSFIKLGQLLSTREDIFGPAFIAEMKLLQNNVEKIDFEFIKPIIEEAFEGKMDEIFSDFDENAIGVASIGVVYRAKLKTGEDVVLKVRKPGIASLIKNDFEILKFIAVQVERVSDEIKYIGISRILDDFEKSIKIELNFNIEALNSIKIKTNLEKIDKDEILYVPKIYKEFSTEDILVIEELKGVPFNSLVRSQIDDELMRKMDICVHLFLHTLLVDGFFHADLHGGNFFLLESGKIGIIDFGLMGTLSKKSRDSLVAILYSLEKNNYENLVSEFLDVSEYEIIPNEEQLTRDLKDSLRPFIGLSVQETNVNELVHALITTLSKHQLYLPQEWFIIFRAIITLDGVGKSLGIDLNIFKIIEQDLTPIMKQLLSKEAIKEELMWVGRDVLNSVRVIPRHLRWYLKESSKNNYAVELKIGQLDKNLANFNRGIYFLGLIAMTCIFTFCGAWFVREADISTLSEIPSLTWVFWTLAILMFLKGNSVFKYKKF
jgi:ubiquinone biosynthesis protein